MTIPVRGERPWVFLVHTLDQVGPPVYLLHLLRWMEVNAPMPVEVVSLADGRLRAEVADLGRVTVLGEPEPVDDGRAFDGLRTRRRDARRRALVAHLTDPALVYVNTAWSVRLAEYLPPSDAPRVAHIHELEIGLDLHLPARQRRPLLDHAALVIAASQAVADNLVGRHGVDPDRVRTHHEMIDVRPPLPLTNDADRRADLGIGPDDAVVGTLAVVNWRKGPDLFLQLARRLRAREGGRPVHLVWVGGALTDERVRALRSDIEASGLGDRVHHVADTPRPHDWLRSLDAFVLTAREDAYPLACLEAASLAVPTVCFDGYGGMPEFVGSDAGRVVPYPDLDAMAGALGELLDDPDARAAAGSVARNRVRARHAVEVAAPRLVTDVAPLVRVAVPRPVR